MPVRVIDPGRLLPYAAAVLALFLAPGPSVVLAVSRGVAFGRLAAVIAVAGNTVGLALQLAVVLIAPAGIFDSDHALSKVLKLAGAAVLVLLGSRAILGSGGFRAALRSGAAGADRGVTPAGSRGALLRQGVVVGLTNPKGIVTDTSIAPSFLRHAHGHGTGTGAVLILGLIALGLAFLADGAWGLASGTVRGWVGRTSRRLEGLSLGSGVLMILFGAGLVALAVG